VGIVAMDIMSPAKARRPKMSVNILGAIKTNFHKNYVLLIQKEFQVHWSKLLILRWYIRDSHDLEEAEAKLKHNGFPSTTNGDCFTLHGCFKKTVQISTSIKNYVVSHDLFLLP
jgi:hypothetical protein